MRFRKNLHRRISSPGSSKRQAGARVDLQACGWKTHGRPISNPMSDFEGWNYLSRNSNERSHWEIDDEKPVVYFGSFQDLLGRDATGNIKARNEWLHVVNWDLVVFDEYHFRAWRETAKRTV